VLVVDDDVRVQADLKEMLAPAEYDVRAAQGSGDTLIQNAVQIAGRFRPHIAIVDLCLWGDCAPDLSGLDVIEELESAHCILYSAYLNFQVTRLARAERVTWVSKAESPQQLLDAIEHASRTVCARPGAPHIAAPEHWSPLEIVHTLFRAQDLPPAGLVPDLIKHLFPESHTIALEPLGDQAAVAGAVRRGRSALIKVWRDGRRNPLVLKLGPAKRIKQEAGNYEQYIKDNVQGRFYAGIVDQPRYFWDLGGVLYTFMDTRLNDLASFATFYRKHQDPDTILQPLRHLLHDVWGDFYRDSNQPLSPLFAAYDRVLRLQERLERPVAQNLNWPPPLEDLLSELPNPVDWVQQHKDDDTVPLTRLAITHGDLHADNLFVNPDHTWLIDFERSGPGPILRDVTELEVDILTRLVAPTQPDPISFFHLATALARPTEPQALIPTLGDTDLDSETAKALATLQGLRTLAHQVIQIEDQREYLWGLLLDALFVAVLHEQPTIQRDRALILSTVLCNRLDQWKT
jgi:CheY-like chemotaxis protein